MQLWRAGGTGLTLLLLTATLACSASHSHSAAGGSARPSSPAAFRTNAGAPSAGVEVVSHSAVLDVREADWHTAESLAQGNHHCSRFAALRQLLVLRGGKGETADEKGECKAGDAPGTAFAVGHNVTIAWSHRNEKWARPLRGKLGVVTRRGKKGSWFVKFEGEGQEEALFKEEGAGTLVRVEEEEGAGAAGAVRVEGFSAGNAAHLLRRADLLIKAHGDGEESRRLLEAAIAIATTQKDEEVEATAVATLALLHHTRLRNSTAAEELLLGGLKRWPSHAELLCNYGGLLLDDARKDYHKAEQSFVAALKVKPDHVTALTFYGLYVQEFRKEHAEAERLLTMAVRLDPQHPDALSHLGTFLGKVKQDFAGAEALYQQVILVDPLHVNTICNRGLVVQATGGDMAEAEAYYDRALAVDPLHGPSYGFKGALHYSVKRNSSAAARLYQQALALMPSDPAVLSNYAHLLARNGKYGSAEALFRRALASDPHHLIGLCYYASLLAEAFADFDAAEGLYRRALEAAPLCPDALLQYAQLLGPELKRFGEAVTLLAGANQADPANTDIIQYLGQMQAMEKQAKAHKPSHHQVEARKEWERRRVRKVREARRLRTQAARRHEEGVEGEGRAEAEAAAKAAQADAMMANLLLTEEEQLAARGRRSKSAAAPPPARPRTPRSSRRSHSTNP